MLCDMEKKRDWTGNGNGVFMTIGASNHTEKEREENDFYATDPVAAVKLCRFVRVVRVEKGRLRIY